MNLLPNSDFCYYKVYQVDLEWKGWLVIVQQGSLNAHNRGELGKSKERRSEVIITITNIEINTIIVLNLFDKTSI